MPGLSLIYNYKGIYSIEEIESAFSAICHDNRYVIRILFQDDKLLAGFTSYPEYPYKVIDTERYWICIEGIIYEEPWCRIETEIIELQDQLSDSLHSLRESLNSWLLKTTGDFVVVMYNKISRRFVLFNDALGRLPLYYYNDGFIISREIGFLTNLVEDKTIDRIAVAQFLALQYTPGIRTFFEKVFRLTPASMWWVEPEDSCASVDVIYNHNFDNDKYYGRSLKENAAELAKIFTDTCKSVVSGGDKIVLSLSGGLDSRGVGAGLHGTGINFESATFLDHGKYASLDAQFAEKAAEILKSDWQLFNLNPPKGRDMLDLIRMKFGLNFIGMSFFLKFLESVKNRYGSEAIYLTGDGGDQLFHSLEPRIDLKSFRDMIAYNLKFYGFFPIDLAARLVNIDKSDVIEDMVERIQSYPEKNMKLKYVHFMIFDRMYKCFFEGEDRNRCYLWSAAPFFTIRMFNYAMNCPARQKIHFGLYAEFLGNLLPAAAAVRTANNSKPITSNYYKFKRYISLLFPWLLELKEKIVKPGVVLDNYEPDSNWLRCLKKQVENCSAVTDFFDHASLTEYIEQPNRYRKQSLENLFTISSLIEHMVDDDRTLKEFSDSDFI